MTLIPVVVLLSLLMADAILWAWFIGIWPSMAWFAVFVGVALYWRKVDPYTFKRT